MSSLTQPDEAEYNLGFWYGTNSTSCCLDHQQFHYHLHRETSDVMKANKTNMEFSPSLTSLTCYNNICQIAAINEASMPPTGQLPPLAIGWQRINNWPIIRVLELTGQIFCFQYHEPKYHNYHCPVGLEAQFAQVDSNEEPISTELMSSLHELEYQLNTTSLKFTLITCKTAFYIPHRLPTLDLLQMGQSEHGLQTSGNECKLFYA